MNIEGLMQKKTKTCGPHDSVNVAARIMWDSDVGSVPVVDENGRAIAMITDRDICMAALHTGKELASISVESAMSKKLHTAKAKQSIQAAEDLMRTQKVRRLPVVDDDGKLIGIVSLHDLARSCGGAREMKGDSVTRDEVAMTLASIGEKGSASTSRAPRA